MNEKRTTTIDLHAIAVASPSPLKLHVVHVLRVLPHRFHPFAVTTPSKTRSQNRIEALFHEEQTLGKTWAEQDLRPARQTALEVLHLLRLETGTHKDGRQDKLMALRIVESATNDNIHRDCSISSNTNSGKSRRKHGPSTCRLFHVLDDSAQEQPTSSATKTIRGPAVKSRSHVPGFRRSFASKLRRGSAATAPRYEVNAGADKSAERQAPEAIAGEKKKATVELEVYPAPLCSASGYGGGMSERAGAFVASERRKRGEGFLERRGVEAGSRLRSFAGAPGAASSAIMGTGEALPLVHDEGRPLFLAQQVLRLEGTGHDGEGTVGTSECRAASMSVVAVVRAVLEPPDVTCTCDCGKDSRHEGRCEVRGVIRVEAYLPDSSLTLTLRIKVSPAPTVVTTAINGTTAAVDGSDSNSAKGAPGYCTTKEKEQKLSLHVDSRRQEACRSRKQRRRALREARNAETERGLSDTLVAVQAATIVTMSTSNSDPRTQKGRPQNADGVSVPATKSRTFGSQTGSSQRQQQNDAFSMLVIRANVVVPVSRLYLGSGSWREAIGELVGCPDGQRLRTVRLEVVAGNSRVSRVFTILTVSKQTQAFSCDCPQHMNEKRYGEWAHKDEYCSRENEEV